MYIYTCVYPWTNNSPGLLLIVAGEIPPNWPFIFLAISILASVIPKKW